jgi:hypothetical protein
MSTFRNERFNFTFVPHRESWLFDPIQGLAGAASLHAAAAEVDGKPSTLNASG